MDLHRLFEHPITDEPTRRTAAGREADVLGGTTARIREPRAESREPRAESREPRAESREPRAESREPRAESREPRAESREPRAESREPRAESREPLFYFAPGCTMPRLTHTARRQPHPPEPSSPTRATRRGALAPRRPAPAPARGTRRPVLRRFAGLAFASLALCSIAAPAQAQVLVSNAGKPTSGADRHIDSFHRAQPFTTGDNAAGYDLESVLLHFGAIPTDTTGVLTVTINSGLAGASDGTIVHTLTTPTSLTTGLNEFTAPSGATLDARTTYYVVAKSTTSTAGAGAGWNRVSLSSGLDADAASGWEIDETYLIYNKSGTAWTTESTDRAFKIQVKGTVAASPNNANLTDIQVNGGQRTIRTTTPGKNSYITFVHKDTATAVVTQNAEAAGATFEYLDASDRVLANSTISLSEGLNVIKIRVTAADTVTTRTYTLNIVRPHSAPVQDANALMTSYLTPTANTRYKGFYALSGGTSGWMSHRWVQKAQADGIGARIRIDALMSVDNSFTSGDGQRFRANTIAVCFIPSAEIEAGLRLEIGGRAFWLAEGRHFRRGAQCWEWDRPADMSWSLGQRVTVRAYKDGALSGGANHPAMGHPTISGVPRVGETLTAETGTMADEDGLPTTFEYQWLAIDGEVETELTGETSQTYVAATRVIGTRMVAVRVSFDDERGFRETRTSRPVTITAPTYGTGIVQPKEETLWTGQLTPVSTGTGTTGCDNDGGASQACTSTTILSDDEMTNREGENDVVLIENTAGAAEDLELKFGGTGLDVRIGTDERHMALLVGNQRLPLADARKVAAGHYVWAQTNISLAAGTPVEMKLVRKTVTATITKLRGLERSSSTAPLFLFSVRFDRFVAVDRATLATQFSGGTGTSMLVGADAVEPVGHNYVTNVNGEARTVAREFRLRLDGRIAADNDDITVTLTPRPCANGGICTSHGVRVTQIASAVLGQNGRLRASIADGEGRERDGKIDFTVTLSRATDWQILVNYRTEVDTDTVANKRATEDHDYFGVSDGQILFAPGQTEEKITIKLVDDTVEDTGEKFKVVISGTRSKWISPRRPHADEPEEEISGLLRSDGVAIGTILNHEDSTGTTPTTGPAATFDNVPDAHGGAAFTFNLAFGEEFGMSEDALRSAFEVTNGAITALERAEEYINANWAVTVTPGGTEDVTVALNQAGDCSVEGALCTEDGRAIAESVTVEVPETAAPPVATTPLTATFGDVPENHAGGEFTLQLSLSEEPKSDFTYRTFAGGAGHISVLEVTNGTVTRASRVEGNRVWQLRIQPATDADEVTVALPATTDCAATGAICTDDARALSNAPSVTVPKDAPVQAAPLTVRFETEPPAEHDGGNEVRLPDRVQREPARLQLQDAARRLAHGDAGRGAPRPDQGQTGLPEGPVPGEPGLERRGDAAVEGGHLHRARAGARLRLRRGDVHRGRQGAVELDLGRRPGPAGTLGRRRRSDRRAGSHARFRGLDEPRVGPHRDRRLRDERSHGKRR